MSTSERISARIAVKIMHTPAVELDCALFHVSDGSLQLLHSNLADNPYLGKSSDGVNFEYIFSKLVVSYALDLGQTGMLILIRGIRPPSEAESGKSRSEKLKDAIESLKNLAELRALLWGSKS